MATTDQDVADRSLDALQLELELQDVIFTKGSFERFVPAADAAKGVYNLTTSARVQALDSDEGGTASLYVEMTVTMEGLANPKGGKKKSVPGKTFTISMTAEATFLNREPSVEILESRATAIDLMKQVHPVVVSRLRQVAVDMGYRSVKPALGGDYRGAQEEPTVEALEQ